MGCQASKGGGAHNMQLGSICSDLPPPLKLPHRDVALVASAGKKSRAQAYASHTPAITPQAETAPPSATLDRDQPRSGGEIREQSKSGGGRRATVGAEQTGAPVCFVECIPAGMCLRELCMFLFMDCSRELLMRTGRCKKTVERVHWTAKPCLQNKGFCEPLVRPI